MVDLEIETIDAHNCIIRNIRDKPSIKNIANSLTVYKPKYEFNPAYQQGLWDGTYKFWQVENNNFIFPKGFENKIREHFKQGTRKYLQSDDTIETFIKSLNLPFTPYEYQIKCIKEMVDKQRIVGELATGSGKSLIIYVLASYYFSLNKKVVLVVPNITLLNQMAKDFKSYGANENFLRNLGIVGGEYNKEQFIKKIVITTWQSMILINPKQYLNIDVLLVDEVHKASADSFLKKIFPKCTNAYIRFGFTGTIPKDNFSRMAIISGIGEVKTYITKKELVDSNKGTPFEIKIIKFNYPLELNCDFRILSSRFEKLKLYQKQVEYLTNSNFRHQMVVEFLSTITGNTFVLGNRIELLKQLYNLYQKEKRLIIGEVPGGEREEIFKDLENSSGVIVFATDKILGTGVNVKNLNNVVMVSSTTSQITILQSIGRLLRLHPSKDIVRFYDIYDNLDSHILKRHLNERIKLYKEEGMKIKSINFPS